MARAEPPGHSRSERNFWSVQLSKEKILRNGLGQVWAWILKYKSSNTKPNRVNLGLGPYTLPT